MSFGLFFGCFLWAFELESAKARKRARVKTGTNDIWRNFWTLVYKPFLTSEAHYCRFWRHVGSACPAGVAGRFLFLCAPPLGGACGGGDPAEDPRVMTDQWLYIHLKSGIGRNLINLLSLGLFFLNFVFMKISLLIKIGYIMKSQYNCDYHRVNISYKFNKNSNHWVEYHRTAYSTSF